MGASVLNKSLKRYMWVLFILLFILCVNYCSCLYIFFFGTCYTLTHINLLNITAKLRRFFLKKNIIYAHHVVEFNIHNLLNLDFRVSGTRASFNSHP